MDVENSNGDGIYKCDVCNFESQYSQNLQIHFKSLKHMTNIDAWTLEFTNNETNGFEEPKSNIRKSIGRYQIPFKVFCTSLVSSGNHNFSLRPGIFVKYFLLLLRKLRQTKCLLFDF